MKRCWKLKIHYLLAMPRKATIWTFDILSLLPFQLDLAVFGVVAGVYCTIASDSLNSLPTIAASSTPVGGSNCTSMAL